MADSSLTEFAKKVLGGDLEPWQLRVLSHPRQYRSVSLQLPRRRAAGFPALERLRDEWLDGLMPERKVGRTVAEWHDQGLLTPRQDTPMLYSVPRMLDLDR